MNPTPSIRYDFSKPLARKELISLLNTAMSIKEFRFARQGALAWLAIFPGDLQISYLLANAMIGEGKNAQARPLLEKIIAFDPEYSLAQEALNAISNQKARPTADSRAPRTDWERAIDASQRALVNNQQDDAEQLALKAIQARPDSPLPAIHYLKIAHILHDFPAIQKLAESYHQHFPDCLQICLFLAEARLVNGDETNAVALLHQCVSQDPAGQVPIRIWGPAFPYRPMWPDRMEIKFDLPIPTRVAMAMGWNQLVPGEARAAGEEPQGSGLGSKSLEEDTQGGASDAGDSEADTPILIVDADGALVGAGAGAPWADTSIEAGLDSAADASTPAAGEADSLNEAPVSLPDSADQPDVDDDYGEFSQEEDASSEDSLESSIIMDDTTADQLLNVQAEFEKLAKKIKRPAIGRSDGRFPMYVVFSSRNALVKVYGQAMAATLDEQMRSLVQAIRKRPDWGALVFYPDDPACTAPLGVKPIRTVDPWSLKLSLKDLDQALGRRGEMIGNLLIVGGPDVIPFHHLPNPVEDSDAEVLSDNPYATSDDNYFIPEWPVGRLPAPAGSDGQWLVNLLQRTVTYHETFNRAHPFWYRNDLARQATRSIRDFLFNLGLVKGTRPSFGYTAQVWRSSSVEVFRPVGKPLSMLACPPVQAGTWNNGKLPAHMGYFNLHGIEDGAEWYGQRKPGGKESDPDYPVAISLKDIQTSRQAPGIIFSEACYGALIENKKDNDALAYKFLANGTYGLVGSTVVSYGSVSTPLIAADLLGFYFWQEVHQGQSTGNALFRSKLKMAKEMVHRQGYLDGEDQKTLLSFVLYGDPLAMLDEYRPMPKTILRTRKHPVVKMISDTRVKDVKPEKIPIDVVVHVKEILDEYLPGLKDAELSLIRQECDCLKSSATCSSCQVKAKLVSKAAPNRYVITLSKEVVVSKRVHHHYARMTIDPQGKVIKVTASR